jgi:hypothetical protein
MVAFLFFVLLFAVLAAAGIAGWGVDSRDSRFSLWPLTRHPAQAPHRPGERGEQPSVGMRRCCTPS